MLLLLLAAGGGVSFLGENAPGSGIYGNAIFAIIHFVVCVYVYVARLYGLLYFRFTGTIKSWIHSNRLCSQLCVSICPETV